MYDRILRRCLENEMQDVAEPDRHSACPQAKSGMQEVHSCDSTSEFIQEMLGSNLDRDTDCPE